MPVLPEDAATDNTKLTGADTMQVIGMMFTGDKGSMALGKPTDTLGVLAEPAKRLPQAATRTGALSTALNFRVFAAIVGDLTA